MAIPFIPHYAGILDNETGLIYLLVLVGFMILVILLIIINSNE